MHLYSLITWGPNLRRAREYSPHILGLPYTTSRGVQWGRLTLMNASRIYQKCVTLCRLSLVGSTATDRDHDAMAWCMSSCSSRVRCGKRPTLLSQMSWLTRNKLADTYYFFLLVHSYFVLFLQVCSKPREQAGGSQSFGMGCQVCGR
jgi:hypothetical protein